MFSFLKKSAPAQRTIDAIYGMIVAQARQPAFYAALHVPDTVDGRFDMVLLHLWMALRVLRQDPAGEEPAQKLFDRFCTDMDDNLREMGVGDLTVPKRMRKFGEAFYGRSAAYDAALEEGHAELAAALNRNIFNEADAADAERLAAYVAEALAQLYKVDQAAFAQGEWQFPPVGGLAEG
ncbi:ubiquinol-cytochrome C chaperone family protein [[Pseudomonas] carboxydohydrogena]|uniref:Ubiquinol-cytochrome C chaperone family protein n=1 Tax=Afipia carboxydohydrogena TaxID=290 RepID=A0ABY8BSM2_AFICR|nr:ubiquinol-cytochrome C chaperone family protein [[Pseudomonas] carboxydohydrogena]WEF52988.1 ubiquinol-cytochrome C chaperone family protein [[Pseudomonas] carboxydohydrogena]